MRIIVSNICFDLKLSAAPVLSVRFRCVLAPDFEDRVRRNLIVRETRLMPFICRVAQIVVEGRDRYNNISPATLWHPPSRKLIKRHREPAAATKLPSAIIRDIILWSRPITRCNITCCRYVMTSAREMYTTALLYNIVQLLYCCRCSSIHKNQKNYYEQFRILKSTDYNIIFIDFTSMRRWRHFSLRRVYRRVFHYCTNDIFYPRKFF